MPPTPDARRPGPTVPPWAAQALAAAARLREAGRLGDAVEEVRAILARNPRIAVAEATLGPLLVRMGDRDAAIEAYRRALKLDPRIPGAAFNLGALLLDRYALEEAIEAFAHAARLEPDSAEARAQLGTALFRQGRVAEAERAYRRALALRPEDHRTHSNLIYMMLHLPGAAERAVDEAREWGRRHATVDPARIAPHPNGRDPHRRLRVGYVSPDMRDHPIGALLTPVFRGHDRAAVEVFAYAEVARPDAVTERLQALADHWRPIAGMSDAALAEQVRADGIDILIDQAGHTARNRLRMFALKPAPVQAAWLGGGGTTGVQAIDYMLGDQNNMPPGADVHYAEAVVRMPVSWGAARAPSDARAIAPPPVLERGYVTFASFNRLEKTHPGVIAAWARVLHAVPGARFLLKTFAMRDAGSRARIVAAFAAHGIPAERLELEGGSRGDAYFARYAAVDIMLDTFPYAGGTISRDAMLSGVPVVTLPNLLLTGAMGIRLLRRAKVTELAATSVDDYVAIAAALAGDTERLVRLRHAIPDGLLRGFEKRERNSVPALEMAFRLMWQRWCAGLPPAAIEVPS